MRGAVSLLLAALLAFLWRARVLAPPADSRGSDRRRTPRGSGVGYVTTPPLMEDTVTYCDLCGENPADRVLVDHPTSPELLHENPAAYRAAYPSAYRPACGECDDGEWDEVHMMDRAEMEVAA